MDSNDHDVTQETVNEVRSLVDSRFPLLANFWRGRYLESEVTRSYEQDTDKTWLRSLADKPNHQIVEYLSSVEEKLRMISGVPGFAKLGKGFRSTLQEAVSTVHHVNTAAWFTKFSILDSVEKDVNGQPVDCVLKIQGHPVFVECLAPSRRPATRRLFKFENLTIPAWFEDSDSEFEPRVRRIQEKIRRQLPAHAPSVMSIGPTWVLRTTWVDFAQFTLKQNPKLIGILLLMREPLANANPMQQFFDMVPHWIPNQLVDSQFRQLIVPWA